MIRFDRVTFTYPDARRPALRDVDLTIAEGELCLVVGRTGSGKTTFLGAINGLVPHFTGGQLRGRVLVDGRDTRTHPPRELADVVGMVGQDPLAGFVTDTVEEELAYAMEQLAVPGDVMRKRVEETLDPLCIAHLRHRPLRTLSGGQQQRVAIGSVLTPHPRVLVLDEPTSALDPTAAEEVLAAVTRLVHDLGITVVMAEHRLERVVHHADQVVLLDGEGSATRSAPGPALAHSELAPPVVRLGRLAGWDPLPLSVRDARRAAGPLRERLAAAAKLPPPGPARPVGRPRHGSSRSAPQPDDNGRSTDASGVGHPAPAAAADGPASARRVGDEGRSFETSNGPASRPAPAVASSRWSKLVEGPAAEASQRLSARGLVVRYGEVLALRGVDVEVPAGQIVAVMGRNGSGKSSLLWALHPAGRRQAGSVAVDGEDPKATTPVPVALVPQTPSDLLYLATVDEECSQADRETGRPTGTCHDLLDRIVPGVAGDQHPRDLSEGQRLGLVLAVQLTSAPSVILLDEPTRGLDHLAKARLTALLAELAEAGRAAVVATHDVEFVARTAHRVIVLAEGEVVADGPTADVVVSSPAFAPQVAKVLHPDHWLTVDEVAEALAGAGADP